MDLSTFHFLKCHYQFQGYQDENLSWSGNSIEPGLAKYCWQMMITFSSNRTKVKRTVKLLFVKENPKYRYLLQANYNTSLTHTSLNMDYITR